MLSVHSKNLEEQSTSFRGSHTQAVRQNAPLRPRLPTGSSSGPISRWHVALPQHGMHEHRHLVDISSAATKLDRAAASRPGVCRCVPLGSGHVSPESEPYLIPGVRRLRERAGAAPRACRSLESGLVRLAVAAPSPHAVDSLSTVDTCELCQNVRLSKVSTVSLDIKLTISGLLWPWTACLSGPLAEGWCRCGCLALADARPCNPQTLARDRQCPTLSSSAFCGHSRPQGTLLLASVQRSPVLLNSTRPSSLGRPVRGACATLELDLLLDADVAAVLLAGVCR